MTLTSWRRMAAGRLLRVAALAAAAALAACASFSGSDLVPGKSTAAEVQASMGVPADKLAGADGESIWFYPRGPAGRRTFAARIGPDGVLRGIEQRLTEANRARLQVGKTTTQEVRALLGPPNLVLHFPRNNRDYWEYRMTEGDFQTSNFKLLTLEFSPDGMLRGLTFFDDPNEREGHCITC